ncbi:MAG: carboxypeptidase-like regulatory domain-containing protein, partial [Tannerella sp.]|nr:carboxypeptidase-like regulatory domain-containing protein [Tannerella sp.]
MKRRTEKKNGAVKTIKTGLFVFIFLLSTATFAREGILKGKIVDGRTQETLAGASIVIKEIPNKGVVSDM